MNIFDLEIKLWKKLMQNKYYRTMHNHVNNLYHYDEIIRKKYHSSSSEHHNDNVYEVIKKSDKKIARPFWNLIWPGMICCSIFYALVVYLIWPDIIDVHPFFRIVPSYFMVFRQN
ncbi:hypothetical protein BLA29_003922 [Euroglyphus maynei]|uniref:Uncharacterized protein n=1 Tax=Euroglyphus maynei TaxID=6958 RepID=A0A1Y3AUZ3_EURMA|nr:hypothetical protein BLA29_003922 [Euroglyphus maynei]